MSEGALSAQVINRLVPAVTSLQTHMSALWLPMLLAPRRAVHTELAGSGIAVFGLDAHGHGRSEPREEDDRALVHAFGHLVRHLSPVIIYFFQQWPRRLCCSTDKFSVPQCTFPTLQQAVPPSDWGRAPSQLSGRTHFLQTASQCLGRYKVRLALCVCLPWGSAPMSSWWQVDDYAEYAREVRERFGGAAGTPAFAAGQSMGGLLATHLVLRDQAAWAGLILCSAAIDIEWNIVTRCADWSTAERTWTSLGLFIGGRLASS